MVGRPSPSAELSAPEVRVLAEEVRLGFPIVGERQEVKHQVIDELDGHLTEGPYPMSAKDIARLVGLTTRSVIRQRSRRRHAAQLRTRLAALG